MCLGKYQDKPQLPFVPGNDIDYIIDHILNVNAFPYQDGFKERRRKLTICIIPPSLKQYDI